MEFQRVDNYPTALPLMRFQAAALAAIVLLVTFGIGYRTCARELARPTQSVPLPPGTLSRLPMQIGKWAGRDVPLDPAIVRATSSDDHVNRTYFRHAQTEKVGLFVAYGVRARDLMPHRPEVCYPGAGWALKATRTTELAADHGGSPLVCRIYRFQRGSLDLREMLVLNYYIVDGRYCPDVSMLRAKAWRGSEAIHYMAQVQITCVSDVLSSSDGPEKNLCGFAAESAAAIRALLPSDGGKGTEVR